MDDIRNKINKIKEIGIRSKYSLSSSSLQRHHLRHQMPYEWTAEPWDLARRRWGAEYVGMAIGKGGGKEKFKKYNLLIY